jgi:ankyrin repeat protein
MGALHWAAEKNSIEILRALLKAKADPNITDNVSNNSMRRIFSNVQYMFVGWHGTFALGS